MTGPSTASPPPRRGDRTHRIVVFGATSFVGQILCRTLVERLGTDGSTSWAIAGRNPAKLADVAAETGADVPVIVANALDPEAMVELTSSADVVISTVGPYARFGTPLVAAAASTGTDYCDLTGEMQWMRAMIDAHHRQAVDSGARIVHACGFDSIPSDLGVWFLQRQARAAWGTACNRVGLRVKAARGGVSGGTLASMANVAREARHDPGVRHQLRDPYSLAPESMRSGPRQPEVLRPTRDQLSGSWVGPFLMAPVNARVVQRTHALLGRPWGDDFAYDEAMLTGGGPAGALGAGALAAATVGAMAAVSASPTLRLVERFGPSPGEGPSPRAQEAGFFDLRLFGRSNDGRSIEVKVTGDRDPGYGATARMLAEAALAFDDLDGSANGGFWTPASLFGDLLIDRLVAHAGMTFEVLDRSD